MMLSRIATLVFSSAPLFADALTKFLAAHPAAPGFLVHNVPGDGHCQYHSFIAAAGLTGIETVDSLRGIVGDQAKYYFAALSGETGAVMAKATSHQARRGIGKAKCGSSCWGDQGSIAVLADVFDVRVQILGPVLDNIVYGNNPAFPLIYLFYDGKHYQWATAVGAPAALPAAPVGGRTYNADHYKTSKRHQMKHGVFGQEKRQIDEFVHACMNSGLQFDEKECKDMARDATARGPESRDQELELLRTDLPSRFLTVCQAVEAAPGRLQSLKDCQSQAKQHVASKDLEAVTLMLEEMVSALPAVPPAEDADVEEQEGEFQYWDKLEECVSIFGDANRKDCKRCLAATNGNMAQAIDMYLASQEAVSVH
jgi:hypothetical protein